MSYAPLVFASSSSPLIPQPSPPTHTLLLKGEGGAKGWLFANGDRDPQEIITPLELSANS